MLQKLFGGFAVKAFLSSHELRELLLLRLMEPQSKHAFVLNARGYALHLSQADGVHFIRGVRRASVVLQRGAQAQAPSCELRILYHISVDLRAGSRRARTLRQAA